MTKKTAESPTGSKSRGSSQPRESIVFYRSPAFYSPLADSWHLHIRGSIFSTAPPSFRKGILLHLFRRVVKPENELEVRERFNQRAKLFLQDGRKGKKIPIAIASKSFEISTSYANGHFESTVTLPAKDLESSIQTDRFGRQFVQFYTSTSEQNQPLYTGEIELIPNQGICVVSDVDDTIKDSNVRDRKELLANTFSRVYRGIEGMSNLYQSWARPNVSFHYVSATPWPLYEPLVDWLSTDGFPTGTMHLRHVRLRDFRGDRTRQAAFLSKKLAIENLLRMYPARQFIFCGDSGERDAELYGEISASFGNQILHVGIRDLRHDGITFEEIEKRFTHLPRDRWTFFQKPSEIANLIPSQQISAQNFANHH